MNAPFPRRQRPISIAILAMGGEGGGVLADWIVDLAESNHYIAQLTSVPGVAQRTGATIYYLEIYPRAGVIDAAHEPVLALMPTPGDVNVVIASELMEAGRAIQRGLITPDRTTLIASTNPGAATAEAPTAILPLPTRDRQDLSKPAAYRPIPGELLQGAENCLPNARPIIRVGIERSADYQGLDYARLYLDRLMPIAKAD